MDLMDIFTQDAFKTATLTAAVNKRPYQPNYLGTLGIFTPMPIRDTKASIAINDEGDLKIVQTTERGSAPLQQTVPARSMRAFETPRIAVADTIKAHELQSMLARAVMQG